MLFRNTPCDRTRYRWRNLASELLAWRAAFVRARRSPYLATRADLKAGTPGTPRTTDPDGYLLTIEFGAPAPLGMLH
jgi:hypothetical protein